MWLFGPNIKKMKEKRDVSGLVEILISNQDLKKKQAAANALGEIKDSKAVEPLLQTLEQCVKTSLLLSDKINEMKSRWGLKYMERTEVEKKFGRGQQLNQFDSVMNELTSSQDVQVAMLEALGEIKDVNASEKLVRMLLFRDQFTKQYNDKRVSQAARTAVIQSGDTTILIDALSSGMGDPYIIIQLLGSMGGSQAANALLGEFKNKKNSWAALEALGQLKDPSTFRPVLDALNKSQKVFQSYEDKKALGFPAKMINVLNSIIASATTEMQKEDLDDAARLADITIINYTTESHRLYGDYEYDSPSVEREVTETKVLNCDSIRLAAIRELTRRGT
jgi:HEAT repeat protein